MFKWIFLRIIGLGVKKMELWYKDFFVKWIIILIRIFEFLSAKYILFMEKLN
jgi:hypothetical protein